MRAFEFGQVVRVDYAIAEYWVEMLILERTEKKYRVVPHRKSHRGVECASDYKLNFLDSFGRVVNDLHLPTCAVPS